MVGNPKMDPPHIKTSCGTQNKNSNPMGIGLGIDYVTWWEILKWIPPTSKLPMGIGLGSDYVTWWEILKWDPNIKTSSGTQNKNSSYGYRVRN